MAVWNIARRSSLRTSCSTGISSCSAISCHGTKRAGVASCGLMGRQLFFGHDSSSVINASGRLDPDSREFWSVAAAKSERSRKS